MDMFTRGDQTPAWIARLSHVVAHSSSLTCRRPAPVTCFSPHSRAIQTDSKRSQTPTPLKNGVQTPKEGATVAHGLCV